MESVTLAPIDMDAVLCLVAGEDGIKRCYFTTAPITEQWGDDWNDAPHFCNAGEPYMRDGHQLYVVTVDGASFPGEWCSAEQCNRGETPWLVDGADWDGQDERRVYGGITLREFVAKCREFGWTIYWPARREAA